MFKVGDAFCVQCWWEHYWRSKSLLCILFPLHAAIHAEFIVGGYSKPGWKLEAATSGGVRKVENHSYHCFGSLREYLNGLFPLSQSSGPSFLSMHVPSALDSIQEVGAGVCPTQRNHIDCGPLVACVMRSLAWDLPFDFSQETIDVERANIALQLIKAFAEDTR
eukprot:gb/GECG01016216.1/.p1 GENE.gb/GECG01016216.1/~~gb/GECG01016216.1/.p1  ORF type:complete len:164 (+),score=16.39 gb/GECG01016216.1/:1-492(+)